MRKFAIAAVVLAAYAALCVWLAFAVPDARCPTGECAPPDDAVELVPSDALAYAHADIDSESEQLRAALGVLSELPQSSAEVARRAQGVIALPALGRGGFESEIAPWVGDEVAVALLASSDGPAEPVVLLEIADQAGAEDFASGLGESRQTIDLDGVRIDVDRRGAARADVGGFLAIGSEQAVRRVAETAAAEGGAGSLADEPALARAREELPGARVADVFLSREGIAELVDDARAPLATIAPFVAPGSSEGFFAALEAEPGQVSLQALSVIDPEQDAAEPSFFTAFPGFAPELDTRVRSDALAYLGVGDPGETLEALLEQATSEAPGIASGFDDLARSLDSSDVDLAPELRRAFSGEAALALVPGGPAESADPEAGASSVPGVVLLAELADPDAAREALGALQIPVARALGGGFGPASFEQTEVEGQAASAIQISPALAIAYSIAGETLEAASSVDALAELISGAGGLDSAPRYEAALEGSSGEPVLRAYLDLAGLIKLGERFGLGADPVYAQLAPEIRRLDALGLTVSRQDDLLETDIRLLVSIGD